MNSIALTHVTNFTEFLDDQAIFVFGSNLAGRHGKGAALEALNNYGAKLGVGEGPSGRSYGIPTKDAQIRSRTLTEIRPAVAKFLTYAQDNPKLWFQVTRVGCVLAGFKDEQIAPLFQHHTPNVLLPGLWRKIINPNARDQLIVVGNVTPTDKPRSLAALNHAHKHANFGSLLINDNDDMAALLKEWAIEKNVQIENFNPRPNRWGHNALTRQQRQLCWQGTHLIVLQSTPDTHLEIFAGQAKNERLKVWSPKMLSASVATRSTLANSSYSGAEANKDVTAQTKAVRPT